MLWNPCIVLVYIFSLLNTLAGIFTCSFTELNPNLIVRTHWNDECNTVHCTKLLESLLWNHILTSYERVLTVHINDLDVHECAAVSTLLWKSVSFSKQIRNPVLGS